MTEKKEKAVNLEDLDPEITAPSSSEKNHNETKILNLDDLADEASEKPVVHKSLEKVVTQERFKRKFKENEKEAQKNWLFKKIEIGPKEVNPMFFVKGFLPLWLAYLFWDLRMDMIKREFNDDLVSQVAYSISAEPMLNLLYGMTILLILGGFFYMSLENYRIFSKTSFVLSADGIEGVDSVIPLTTKHMRRRIKWYEIEDVKVNEQAKTPHVSIYHKDRVIIELPLFISNKSDLERAVVEFCPDDNPFRLIVNKFKNS